MDIYACNINHWNELDGFSYLSEERKEKVLRYKQPRDKIRSLVGGLLIYYALGHNKNAQYTKYGKPYFDNDLCFSISHSGDYVLFASSAYDLGVDVEKVKPYSMDVAKKCFTDQEIQWLTQNNSDNNFFKIWTAKESIMKATGLGFSLNPSSFQVLPINDGPHIIDTKKWHMYWHSFDGHEACIASTNRCEKKNITLLNFDEIIQKISSSQAKT